MRVVAGDNEHQEAVVGGDNKKSLRAPKCCLHSPYPTVVEHNEIEHDEKHHRGTQSTVYAEIEIGVRLPAGIDVVLHLVMWTPPKKQ